MGCCTVRGEVSKKLPWFPFYVKDWLGSPRIRRLSGDQMAAYLWLLCEQWEHGHLPFDVIQVSAGVPKGISETAIAYALVEFFPPDPDTNLRRNPRLEEIRQEQSAKQSAQSLGGHRSKSNLVPGAKYRKPIGLADSPPDRVAETEPETETDKKEVGVGDLTFPQQVVIAANAAQRDNPSLSGVDPFRVDMLLAVLPEWEAQGIRQETILRVVPETVARYKPNGVGTKRIGSFRYFTNALLRAEETAKADHPTDHQSVIARVMAAMRDAGELE